MHLPRVDARTAPEIQRIIELIFWRYTVQEEG